MTLAVDVYRLTKRLPPSERFELSKQMRSAAISIPGCIAEGKGRSGQADYARFLSMARGSSQELDTYLELALRLEFLSAAETATSFRLANEIDRMLTSLMRRLTPF